MSTGKTVAVVDERLNETCLGQHQQVTILYLPPTNGSTTTTTITTPTTTTNIAITTTIINIETVITIKYFNGPTVIITEQFFMVIKYTKQNSYFRKPF